MQETTTFEGGCTCRAVRYRMNATPLFVNCCHCRWCQRETGSAFAINALVETAQLTITGDVAPERVATPSASGRGQSILRCPTCRVAVFSHYGGGRFDEIAFVRVGTLDDPDRFPPDIHIWTMSKQPWVQLPTDKPIKREYYKRDEEWPTASLARYAALFASSK